MSKPTIRELLDSYHGCKNEDRSLAIFQADNLAERVEKVLALHVTSRPVECSPGYFACSHCKYEWPCPTLRLLEGEP